MKIKTLFDKSTSKLFLIYEDASRNKFSSTWFSLNKKLLFRCFVYYESNGLIDVSKITTFKLCGKAPKFIRSHGGYINLMVNYTEPRLSFRSSFYPSENQTVLKQCFPITKKVFLFKSNTDKLIIATSSVAIN